MSSPCSHRIIKLRERNRILLDQLESNSILLKRRLKKLTRTARAARYSEKSWQDVPVSPLKRKYESWKARNYSGQVAAAVNATTYTISSSSSNSEELNVECKQKVEDITSPAKRSKQNAQIGSRARSKEVLPCESCKCRLKSSTAVDVRNSGKECEDCYCKKDAVRGRTNSDVSSQESEGSTSALHTGSNIHEEPAELHSVKYNRSTGITENKQQRRTLEAARVIIDYSPESMFLQRLKERSQAVGDLVAPTLAKPGSVTPPKKSLYSEKSTVGTKPMKPTKGSPVKTNPNKSSPLKTRHSSRLPSDHGGHELISDHNQQDTTKSSPCRSLRRTYNDGLKLKKNRKRVCYRKNCHCRVKENIRSTENFPNVIKEKAEAKLANEQGLTNPGTSSSGPCECCCDCSTQQMRTPKTPLITSDVGAGLVDNEHDKKRVQPQCCERGSWFDELNEFRQSHWFDCHAHPHPSGTSRDAARNLDIGSIHPTSHKCVHKYVLDDRLFARPLYSDHQNNSRCMACHLPHNLSKSKMRETPPVTLPSTLQDPEIQVSIPLGSPHGRRPSASGNVLTHKKMTQPSGRSRSASSPRSRSQPNIFMRTLGDLKPRAPPPADSLALRYQKGVAK